MITGINLHNNNSATQRSWFKHKAINIAGHKGVGGEASRCGN